MDTIERLLYGDTLFRFYMHLYICCTFVGVHLYRWYMCIFFQSGKTALINASSEGRSQCVDCLLSYSAEINHQDQVSAVSISIIICLHGLLL